jgi:hypothetical protein
MHEVLQQLRQEGLTGVEASNAKAFITTAFATVASVAAVVEAAAPTNTGQHR